MQINYNGVKFSVDYEGYEAEPAVGLLGDLYVTRIRCANGYDWIESFSEETVAWFNVELARLINLEFEGD